jgi:ribosomal-protein-alanine N-acetyltransferase
MQQPFRFKDSPPDLANLVIEGDRVRLVSMHEQFTQAIYEAFTADITTFMLPKLPEKIEDTQNFVRSSIESFAQGNNLQLVILKRESGEFLGCCGLHGQDNVNRPELGIWLKQSVHGQGLGREAIRTLVMWVQDIMQLEALIYPVDKRNYPSRRIPESLGGKMIAERTEVGMAGNVLDEVVYEIALPIAK